jgi:The (Largely Archaeal Putative) Hydrophobe/Amphiphile Efflux-3 (HAE3) Family
MSLSGLFEKIGDSTNSKRWLVFVVFISLLVVSLYGASTITMYSGMDTYIQKESKMYQDLDHYNKMFSEESVVIMVEGANVKDPAVLEASVRLEKMVSNISGVKSIIGPATLITATNEQLTGRAEIPSTAEEIQAIVDLSPSYYSQLIYDDTHSLILVSYTDLTDAQKEDVLKAVRDAVSFAGFPPGYNIIVTGEAALASDMNSEMSTGMGILLLLAVLLMVLALGLVFRGVRWRLYPLVVVVFGLLYTFGLMGFLGINMTMVSIAAFPILIGLGIDYAIQFHNRMEEELRRCKTRRDAIISTFKHTGPAVLTALFVTVISFFSLLTSAVPMIQDFGKLLILGCSACYISALFFGVVSLYFMDKLSEKIAIRDAKRGQRSLAARIFSPVKRDCDSIGFDGVASENEPAENNIITKTLNKVINFTMSHKKTIFVVAIITGSIGFYADSAIPAETDFKTYIPQDMPALVDFFHMGSVMGGSGTVNIMIETDNIASPILLKWMDEFGTYQTTNQMYVHGASSLASVVKERNGGVIPDTEEEILAIYEQLPASTMSQYSYGNSMLLLNLNIGSAMDDLPMDGLKTLVEIIEEDLTWHQLPPGSTATITGSTVPFIELLGSLLNGRVQQTILGVVLVFVTLLLIYRDFFKATAPVLSIVLVIGWSGIVMYTFNIVYTPMTAVMGCMILGAGSEYSILLMERFYEEKAHGLPAADAMRTAVSSTGIALVVSGLTTVFGFLALTASAFGIVSSFGVVTVINMVMTLLASFVVFPPLMLTFDGFRDRGVIGTLVHLKNSVLSAVKPNKNREMI